jgi:hypothetical protein
VWAPGDLLGHSNSGVASNSLLFSPRDALCIGLTREEGKPRGWSGFSGSCEMSIQLQYYRGNESLLSAIQTLTTDSFPPSYDSCDFPLKILRSKRGLTCFLWELYG